MFTALGNLVAYQWLGLLPDSRLGQAVQFFVMDVVQIFVLLGVIIYLMGLLRTLVSSEKVREYVQGKPKWMARSLAILLGALTPFCSCSSVPLFIGFVEAGVPLGVTYSFLIASPMINEIAMVMLISILGWEVALLYLVAGLVVAYVGGVLMEKLKPERWVEDYVWKIQMGQVAGVASDNSLRGRHHNAVAEVKEIFRRLWKWVLVGIALGALFHGYVPQEWVETYLAGDQAWWSVPAAVLLGIPLYSNAVGVIPIIEAMLGKGVPIGSALALMMSIAALSLPELIILRKVVKWPALIWFAGILAVAFMLVGWLFNYIFA
ncbi:MAG: permease [Thiomicrospira sp.]|uniref:permease n=1 Tax=Thiomicrospira sp. TaxID=935 RepID=UPI0019F8C5C0|nr:permease [Thiomicrospira sp.]MBE0493142.1 permease [Thiomicrospira sp.]